MSNSSTPKVESKSNPPQPQLSQQAFEILQDLEEFFQQMEIEGCPAATANELRELTRIAAAQTLAESAQRNLLFLEIEQSMNKLRPKRFMSGFPKGSSKALDEIEGFASQLPDSAERRSVLRRVKQIRGCLPGGVGDE